MVMSANVKIKGKNEVKFKEIIIVISIYTSIQSSKNSQFVEVCHFNSDAAGCMGLLVFFYKVCAGRLWGAECVLPWQMLNKKCRGLT